MKRARADRKSEVDVYPVCTVKIIKRSLGDEGYEGCGDSSCCFHEYCIPEAIYSEPLTKAPASRELDMNASFDLCNIHQWGPLVKLRAGIDSVYTCAKKSQAVRHFDRSKMVSAISRIRSSALHMTSNSAKDTNPQDASDDETESQRESLSSRQRRLLNEVVIRIQSLRNGLLHISQCTGCESKLCTSTRNLILKVRSHKCEDQEKCRACRLWSTVSRLHHTDCKKEAGQCTVPSCANSQCH